ncbi:IS5 family transposase [Xanthomonas citri]|uniref:IS5/IS1182 family transposase n=1 Tax=Xanthomonas citri pv. vignicola TaxID=473426 RepID=A0AB33CTZ7_XANCI|nr:IS5 family transposase [Xanthomonas citri]ASK91259.1 IS5/IS1182 family transposase [Xanthomonas citri pv. vignicola]ASK93475.1 IS5/IS1182 family transposase [Xanthomonas citri pv. vignicola]ASK93649.1 IS5/IS1182 family transposase [Xanthomonas citri pv. vignicola]ASK94011.1 IS5/IS1182 family transposase [Xanthomonas citri pv. vignicola]
MQLTFGDAEGLGKRKQTRREMFLAEMEQVVPWQQLLWLIAPHYPVSGRPGRQPYALATMLRIHLLQQWYALSDPAMEEALHEIPTLRRFAQLGGLDDIPDETTILNFRRLLETHGLAARMLEAVNAHLARKGQSLRSGTIVDATLIAAPSSTKNADHARDPEMHQTRKGNQWYFGMKAHIGVDEFSGLVHHVHCTAANVADVTVMHTLLHGKEDSVFGDSGYTGADKREELQDCEAAFFIAARPSTIQAIANKCERAQEQRWERFKASVRAKVEHPFRVIKRQFGYTKVRYRGLAKNTAQVLTLFALSNLWMKRKQLLPAMGSVRL